MTPDLSPERVDELAEALRPVVEYRRHYGLRVEEPRAYASTLAPLVARWVAEAETEALQEAADDWPREINAATIRREIAHPNLRDAPPDYTPADWLRDRAARINPEGQR